MKDTLNAKIKRWESFRPFAPSVLRELVPTYFEQTVDPESNPLYSRLIDAFRRQTGVEV